MVYVGLGAAAVVVLAGSSWSASAVAAALMALLLVSIHAEWDLVTFLAPMAVPPAKPGETNLAQARASSRSSSGEIPRARNRRWAAWFFSAVNSTSRGAPRSPARRAPRPSAPRRRPGGDGRGRPPGRRCTRPGRAAPYNRSLPSRRRHSRSPPRRRSATSTDRSLLPMCDDEEMAISLGRVGPGRDEALADRTHDARSTSSVPSRPSASSSVGSAGRTVAGRGHAPRSCSLRRCERKKSGARPNSHSRSTNC